MPEALTQHVIDKLLPDPAGKDIFVWGNDPVGLGIRVKPTGSKAYVLQYRNKYNVVRRMTLGRCNVLPLKQARDIAKEKLIEVAQGNDPASDKSALRDALTVADLCDAYMKNVKAGLVLKNGRSKKPLTIAGDEARINRHIKPLIGKLPILAVTYSDVEKLNHDITQGKTAFDKVIDGRRVIVRGGAGAAAKSVKLLSAIFVYAIKKQLIDKNPCQYVDVAADGKRDRFLNAKEYRRLGDAIRAARVNGLESVHSKVILTLALTGCRKSEIQTLRREDLDRDGNCLRLVDTKTGRKDVRDIRPCGETPLEFLSSQVSDHTPWVFPSTVKEGPATNLRKHLRMICKMAGLTGVSSHTLRHSYATVAHELNYSELTIAGLLGHRKGSVTATYAHHVEHTLAAAANAVSALIAKRMGFEMAQPLECPSSQISTSESL